MAKIATSDLAVGKGWRVSEVVCQSGPDDRAFEERHSAFQIAVVTSGSFQYQSSTGRELMTPGALLLGNFGQCFECRHEHGVGDRCLSFGYSPEYFDTLGAGFRSLRVPPVRELSPVISRALAGDDSWEEIAVDLALRAMEFAGASDPRFHSPSAEARMTRAVRYIERSFTSALTLEDLAREAGLSPFHFLRSFEQLTGLTPHQYLIRTRLREAARRIRRERTSILDIALDCGFGDVSNFNRNFRREFGASPRSYRVA